MPGITGHVRPEIPNKRKCDEEPSSRGRQRRQFRRSMEHWAAAPSVSDLIIICQTFLFGVGVYYSPTLETVEMPKLRQHGISNLTRWRDSGVWCSAFGEWLDLLVNGSDAQVLEAMIGESENSNRLRQSPPYTGLLSESDRIKLWRTHIG